MKNKKLIVGLGAASCLALSFGLFTACTQAPAKSAYDIAKENGFTGTEAEWLESLKGANGADAFDHEHTYAGYSLIADTTLATDGLVAKPCTHEGCDHVAFEILEKLTLTANEAVTLANYGATTYLKVPYETSGKLYLKLADAEGKLIPAEDYELTYYGTTYEGDFMLNHNANFLGGADTGAGGRTLEGQQAYESSMNSLFRSYTYWTAAELTGEAKNEAQAILKLDAKYANVTVTPVWAEAGAKYDSTFVLEDADGINLAGVSIEVTGYALNEETWEYEEDVQTAEFVDGKATVNMLPGIYDVKVNGLDANYEIEVRDLTTSLPVDGSCDAGGEYALRVRTRTNFNFTVTDNTGAPVEGATVAIYPADDLRMDFMSENNDVIGNFDSMNSVYTFVTGADGKVTGGIAPRDFYYDGAYMTGFYYQAVVTGLNAGYEFDYESDIVTLDLENTDVAFTVDKVTPEAVTLDNALKQVLFQAPMNGTATAYFTVNVATADTYSFNVIFQKGDATLTATANGGTAVEGTKKATTVPFMYGMTLDATAHSFELALNAGNNEIVVTATFEGAPEKLMAHTVELKTILKLAEPTTPVNGVLANLNTPYILTANGYDPGIFTFTATEAGTYSFVVNAPSAMFFVYTQEAYDNWGAPMLQASYDGNVLETTMELTANETITLVAEQIFDENYNATSIQLYVTKA